MPRKKAPRHRKRIILTDKEEAVLRAIEELGEAITIGELRKRAGQILKRIRARNRRKKR